MWVEVTFGFVGKETVDFFGSPVVSTDYKTVVVHVQDEVLALLGGEGREREGERERGKGDMR